MPQEYNRQRRNSSSNSSDSRSARRGTSQHSSRSTARGSARNTTRSEFNTRDRAQDNNRNRSRAYTRDRDRNDVVTEERASQHTKASRAPRRDHHQEDGVRLQKVLAQAGFGSRRKCEELILDGRVEVDGDLVLELGTRVNPDKQKILVDGSRIHLHHDHITLALHKPKKVLSTMSDPKGRWTLRDIIGDKYERVFHMGRLDYDSEGLILMTDDGELSQHVMHPKYEVSKTYIATVEGKLTGGTARRLVRTGVNLDDGWVKLDKCTILDQNRDYTMVRVVLHSGKNRIVRRIFGSLGFPVHRLVRTQIGPIKLGELKAGSYRVLSPVEVKSLEKEVGL